ncbi:hypothetical protein D5S17_14505 [Pseudonocardiaceae bacterium YIM PH 21723]|nr:hypothetical protein D5S17_14505 [Pseudonocardiaceae bacterium YIM PH 21723]
MMTRSAARDALRSVLGQMPSKDDSPIDRIEWHRSLIEALTRLASTLPDETGDIDIDALKRQIARSEKAISKLGGSR